MSTRKAFKRTAAPHETPPPAVCGRLHVAVAESEHLASVGGGSLPAPDTCRPITPEYAEEAHSLDPDEIRAALGLTFDELAALTTEDFYTLARRKPLELIGLLQMHGLASSVWTLFPADVRSLVKDMEARKRKAGRLSGRSEKSGVQQ